jgi:hypothetical protein
MMGEEAEDGEEDLATAAEVVFQRVDDPCSTATIISIRREDKKDTHTSPALKKIILYSPRPQSTRPSPSPQC